jgi:hypothetical protein
MTVKQLERAAIRAHARGETFNQFWERYGEAIRNAGPRDRFNSLYRKLLCIVVSGDGANTEPLGDDAPWFADDEQHKPADVGTAAKWQGMPQEARA